MTGPADDVVVRNTRPGDFAAISELCRRVYPFARPWSEHHLASHLEYFPEGQFVAIEAKTDSLVGMSASLILSWEDYDHIESYVDFTDRGMFTNHDPAGRTLYGAEVMVDPAMRRRGIGSRIYAARRQLVERMGLLRIRAGARLPNYHRHATALSADEYVVRVIRGELTDPTLTFQLKNGFEVLDVVSDYFSNDPRGRDFAAFIEWINMKVARPEDYAARDPRYQRP